MAKNLILTLFAAVVCPVYLCAFAPAGQQAEPTFDPFASGSFYEAGSSDTEPKEAADGEDPEESSMVFIPESPFIMGSDDETAPGYTKPAHEVFLKGFWIDRYEVTNADFAKCAETGFCFSPRDHSSASHPDYYTNPEYADHPVIHVDWHQANAYCTWAGKRLPTEAEWEKAARGPEGAVYPWGNDLPEELPAQINLFEAGDTAPVNSHPEGKSPYGVYNMEGNVWEWTADQYDRFYYSKSPYENPRSVTGGNDYVIRGYSWAYPFHRYEISARNSAYVMTHTYDLGFRCAKDGNG